MTTFEDPRSRIERLIALARPELRARFILIVAQIRREHTLTTLADLLQTGRLAQAEAVLERIAVRLGGVWSEQFSGAARSTGNFLSREVRSIQIDFDQVNGRAVRVMQENQLRLVREFTSGQREATREALLGSLRRGESPIQAARGFRDSIGLTRRQVMAVENYRRALESGTLEPLQRQLRDKRFDRSVRSSVRRDIPIPQERVDRMVDRYRERMINFRAQTIARTESLRSVHEGVEEMYQQAIDAGELRADEMTRIWNTAGSGVRDSHSPMNGQRRTLDEPFTSGRGNRAQHPGGFRIGAEDIRCRCAVSRTFDVIDVEGEVGIAFRQGVLA